MCRAEFLERQTGTNKVRKAASSVTISRNAGRKLQAGFTLLELMISVAVMLILSAIAIPSVMQGWNSYRLTAAADNVAGILQRTRFEAIHKNTNVSCIAVNPPATGWAVGIDENANGALDNNEPQVALPGPPVMIGAGVAPGPATLGYPTATLPPANTVTFNSRGTLFIAAPGAPPAYVYYIGIPGQPKYGYRAVTITQMGQVKVWMAQSGGSWVGQ